MLRRHILPYYVSRHYYCITTSLARSYDVIDVVADEDMTNLFLPSVGSHAHLTLNRDVEAIKTYLQGRVFSTVSR